MKKQTLHYPEAVKFTEYVNGNNAPIYTGPIDTWPDIPVRWIAWGQPRIVRLVRRDPPGVVWLQMLNGAGKWGRPFRYPPGQK